MKDLVVVDVKGNFDKDSPLCDVDIRYEDSFDSNHNNLTYIATQQFKNSLYFYKFQVLRVQNEYKSEEAFLFGINQLVSIRKVHI